MKRNFIDIETGTIEEPGKIVFFDSYEVCDICGRAPTTIYYEDGILRRYWHCPDHMKGWSKLYKPETWFKKLLWFVDKRVVDK